jgi:PAS domain S-box-containing protein
MTTLFDSIAEGFCIVDVLFDEGGEPRDFLFLEINPMFEIQSGVKNPVGKTARKLNPSLEHSCIETYAKVALTGEPIRFEHRVEAMNSWFDVYAIRAGGQESRKIAIFFKNITERKRVEVALQQSQSRIESILSSVADIHILLNRDWRYLYINEAGVRAMGRTREQILGRTLWELYPDIVGTELDRQIHRAMEEQVFVALDFHYLTLDHWWEDRFYPAPDGLSVFATNITERKRVEEQLRQSEERFRQLAESITEVFWMTNPDKQQMLYVSPTYEKIWGRPCETLYEAPTTWLDVIHPDDRDRVEKSASTQQILGSYDEEFRIIRPDGSVRWIRDRAFPINDEMGRVYRITGLAEDITERKLIDEKVRETTEQLRALSAKFQSAREEEGIRIARELHDELGAALTSLKWDLESFDKVLSESRDQSELKPLRGKVEDMVRLSENTISTVRRISSELRPRLLDDLGLGEAIGWQAQQFQARSGIICHCEGSVENVDLNQEHSTAVFRIFQEALTNILRHAQATTVDIDLREEAGELVLTVSDNGRGITAPDKARGQSLGLLGMRERARLIGGVIEITGVEAKGTVVILRVPILSANFVLAVLTSVMMS